MTQPPPREFTEEEIRQLEAEMDKLQVDDVLLQGDCNGVLHAYDVSDTTVAPPEIWQIEIGGCIESTPAVWRASLNNCSNDSGNPATFDPATLPGYWVPNRSMKVGPLQCEQR